MKEIEKGNVYGRNFGLVTYYFQLKHYINERLQTFKVNGFLLVITLGGCIENVLRDFQFL